MINPTAKEGLKILIKIIEIIAVKIVLYKVLLNLKGRCELRSLPRLVSTFPSSVQETLFNLANKYGNKVKEPKNPHPFSFIKAIYAPRGIATQVSTFQKLSVVIKEAGFSVISCLFLSLTSIICIASSFLSKLCFKVVSLILSKISCGCKTIVHIFITFSLLCATPAYASKLVKQIPVTIKEILNKSEKEHNIPAGLLTAIAKVESRFNPYALNLAGKSLIAKNSEEAEIIIQKAITQGIDNIDIGIMQLNMRWHQSNFSSFQEMLDPKANIKYAAAFLSSLYQQYGDWHTAVRYYHSRTPKHYRKYSRKVTLAWVGS